MGGAAGIEALAGRVRVALESGNLAAHADLLAHDARWGPPDDPEGGCHDRAEILAWYAAMRERGVRFTLNEVVSGVAAIVVGVSVTGNPAAEVSGGSVERWLVMAVGGDQIVDIRGYDDREVAFARAGIGP